MAITINNLILFDFSENRNPERWQVVNDGVMGGLSQGTIKLSENGTGLFTGKVSLENNDDYFSYITTFKTSGKWETVELPLNEMVPSFRGRKLDLPNYNGNTIVELTFLIGNNKAESFALELQKAFLK
jgi:hypothetical protein